MISKISGFLWEEDGQYIAPGKANTLKPFEFIKLYKVTPCELFTLHPHDQCLALISQPIIPLFLIVLKY